MMSGRVGEIARMKERGIGTKVQAQPGKGNLNDWFRTQDSDHGSN